MSREYVANVVLGLRFTIGEAVVARRVVDSCEHEERIGRRFCSECGVRVWQRTEWDEDAEDRLVSKIGKALPTNYVLLREDDGDHAYFLGYGFSHGHRNCGSGFLPADDPNSILFKIEDILTKVGISQANLDDVQFGLHAFVTSY